MGKTYRRNLDYRPKGRNKGNERDITKFKRKDKRKDRKHYMSEDDPSNYSFPPELTEE